MNTRETLEAMEKLENGESGRYWLEYTLGEEEHWRFSDWAHPLFPIFEACCLNLPKVPENISKIAVGERGRGNGGANEGGDTLSPSPHDSSGQIAIGETDKGKNLATLAVILVTDSTAELKILDEARFDEFIRQAERDEEELNALQAMKEKWLKLEPDNPPGELF